ncbi:MAG: hypothetical protein OQL20_02585 [Sedimenticola sp.]|nr:hypothetical protein [Sedimenticola sp.]
MNHSRLLRKSAWAIDSSNAARLLLNKRLSSSFSVMPQRKGRSEPIVVEDYFGWHHPLASPVGIMLCRAVGTQTTVPMSCASISEVCPLSVAIGNPDREVFIGWFD